jgi:glycosyltransferase involved in cell wall biosynthesis
MRIGIDAQVLKAKNSGVEYCIEDLVLNLAVVDPDNEYVIYVNGNALQNFASKHGNFVIKKSTFLNKYRPIRILWDQALLPAILLKDKIDIFHAPCYVAPVLASVPSVVTIPDLISLLFPNMTTKRNHYHYKLLLPTVVKKARRIITVSQNSKEDLIRVLGVNGDKVDVIANGIHESFKKITNDRQLTRVKEKYNLPQKIILYVGNLEPKKNIEGIIEAFSRLIKAGQIEHTLVIAGKKGWLYDGIFKIVAEQELHQNIRFLGYVPRGDLPALYNLAELFVFPSFYEGFGIPPLEAMACGTPVLTSNVAAVPEVVGDAAVMVDPNEVQEIADAIRDITGDEKIRAALTEKGFERAKLFSWGKTARDTLKVYKKALQD